MRSAGLRCWPPDRRRRVRPSRLGLGVLGICAVGTFGVGVFVGDPVVTPWSAMTTVGRLHVVCGLSALVLLPFAALLINRGLARRLPAAAQVLHWTGWLPPMKVLEAVQAYRSDCCS